MIEASSPPLGPVSSTIQSDHENEIDNGGDDDTNKLYYSVYDDADADADDRIMGADHDDNEYEYEDYHEKDDDDDETMMIDYNMTYTEADDSGDCSSNNESGSVGSGSIRSVMRIGEVFDTISEKHHSPPNSSTTLTTSTTTTTNLTQTSRQKQRKRQRQRQRLRNKALRLENKRDTLKSTTRFTTTKTNNQTMKGNIRGGNSDTHCDCVSCLDSDNGNESDMDSDSNSNSESNIDSDSDSENESIFHHYSNPNNNHDHNKFPHKFEKDAKRETSRMQHQCPGYIFNAYYNVAVESWFVGKPNRSNE